MCCPLVLDLGLRSRAPSGVGRRAGGGNTGCPGDGVIGSGLTGTLHRTGSLASVRPGGTLLGGCALVVFVMPRWAPHSYPQACKWRRSGVQLRASAARPRHYGSHVRDCLRDARSLDPALRRALVVPPALAGGRALRLAPESIQYGATVYKKTGLKVSRPPLKSEAF